MDNCPELSEIEASLDGVCRASACEPVEAHVLGCPRCLQAAQEIESLDTLLAGGLLEQDPKQVRVSPRLHNRLVALGELSSRSTAPRIEARSSRSGRLRRRRSASRWSRSRSTGLAWAAALAVVAAVALVLWHQSNQPSGEVAVATLADQVPALDQRVPAAFPVEPVVVVAEPVERDEAALAQGGGPDDVVKGVKSDNLVASGPEFAGKPAITEVDLTPTGPIRRASRPMLLPGEEGSQNAQAPAVEPGRGAELLGTGAREVGAEPLPLSFSVVRGPVHRRANGSKVFKRLGTEHVEVQPGEAVRLGSGALLVLPRGAAIRAETTTVLGLSLMRDKRGFEVRLDDGQLSLDTLPDGLGGLVELTSDLGQVLVSGAYVQVSRSARGLAVRALAGQLRNLQTGERFGHGEQVVLKRAGERLEAVWTNKARVLATRGIRRELVPWAKAVDLGFEAEAGVGGVGEWRAAGYGGSRGAWALVATEAEARFGVHGQLSPKPYRAGPRSQLRFALRSALAAPVHVRVYNETAQRFYEAVIEPPPAGRWVQVAVGFDELRPVAASAAEAGAAPRALAPGDVFSRLVVETGRQGVRGDVVLDDVCVIGVRSQD